MEAFDRYVSRQVPLPWTVIKEHSNRLLVGNQAMAVDYARLNLILDMLRIYFHAGWKIADIGVYPGILPKIFFEFYPGKGQYEYYGCGLGFSEEFRCAMQEFAVKLLECDLDPRLILCNGRPVKIPLDDEMTDLCIFTDVIEHLFDPFYALKEINRVSKTGGILLLTTDNLTRIDACLAMLKGKSPNVPLIESSLFYQGDWRPHFREYAKPELFQLLEWAGFKVLTHKFYEAQFGLWKADRGRLVRAKHAGNINKGLMRNLFARLLKSKFPYFKDSQIIVARKSVPYDEMVRCAPRLLDNFEEWVSQRRKVK